jgi:hypothetical protein
VTAAQYLVPLREGGSLPAVIEGDDGRLWVAKFRGAGQGALALVAEVIAAGLGRGLGLPIPELCLLSLDEAFGKNEADPEIRDLLVKSAGDNLGVAFLPEALPFDPAAEPPPPGLAERVVAFDAFLQNVDRTAKNPNLLWSGGALWLIDHGAALYWQHAWDGGTASATARFGMIGQHVLLPFAGDVAATAPWLTAGLGDAALAGALAAVPDAWLAHPRDAYAAYLAARRDAAPNYLEEADRARAQRM